MDLCRAIVCTAVQDKSAPEVRLAPRGCNRHSSTNFPRKSPPRERGGGTVIVYIAWSSQKPPAWPGPISGKQASHEAASKCSRLLTLRVSLQVSNFTLDITDQFTGLYCGGETRYTGGALQALVSASVAALSLPSKHLKSATAPTRSRSLKAHTLSPCLPSHVQA